MNTSEKWLKSRRRKRIADVSSTAIAFLLVIVSTVCYGNHDDNLGIKHDIAGLLDRYRISREFRGNPEQFYPHLVKVTCEQPKCNLYNSNVTDAESTNTAAQSSAFELTETEITNKHYKAYLVSQQPSSDKRAAFFSKFGVSDTDKSIQRDWPAERSADKDNLPVVYISWYEAMDYSLWLGEQLDQSCRLPAGEEWEYAATGGDDVYYPWGNSADEAVKYAWYSKNSDYNTQPVKTRQSTSFGLYDMVGNVYEWTTDCDNEKSPQQACNSRVLRGGAFYQDAPYLRASDRFGNPPDDRSEAIGFRVLCVPH